MKSTSVSISIIIETLYLITLAKQSGYHNYDSIDRPVIEEPGFEKHIWKRITKHIRVSA